VVRRQWAVVIAVCLCVMFVRAADAKWAWNPWSGWFSPSDVARGSPKQQYDYAKELMSQEKYREAAEEFRRFVSLFAYSRHAADAQFMVGEALLKAGELNEAFNAYESLLSKFPETDKVNRALRREYEIGDALCSGRSRKKVERILGLGGDRGVKVLNRVIEHNPFDPLAERALMRLGQYYMDSRQYDRAHTTYARVLEEHPKGAHFAQARYLKAVASYKQIEGPHYDARPMTDALKQLKDIQATQGSAEKDVPELIDRIQRTRAKADYDTARFYLRNGKAKAARVYLQSIVQRYPRTRYAQMAAQVLQALPPPTEGNGQ